MRLTLPSSLALAAISSIVVPHSAPAAADVAADDSGAAELDPESDDPEEHAARSRAPAAMAGTARFLNERRMMSFLGR